MHLLYFGISPVSVHVRLLHRSSALAPLGCIANSPLVPPSARPRALADWCSRGHQLVVGPLQSHEVVVGSLLDYVAPRHDGDDVRVLNGGQAMGDDDARPALSGSVQGVLHGLSGRHQSRHEAAFS